MATATTRLFVPREHGATAMLLTPFFAAAILLRHAHWAELVALLSIACAFAIKDPLVVIARQRLVWRQEHAETRPAIRLAVVESLILAASGIVLLWFRDWRGFLVLFLGAGIFTVLAVTLNVRNKQRSEWFQVASAIALSATSLTACLSGENRIPEWCWLLWLLCALQSAAGIFVVHARLDARNAIRKGPAASNRNRRAAFLCQFVLTIAAVWFAYAGRLWISAALFFATGCYLLELRRGKNPESLRMPLKRVGWEALGLSVVYTTLLIIGLWR